MRTVMRTDTVHAAAGQPERERNGGGEADLHFHGDQETGAAGQGGGGVVDLAVNVRPDAPPPWLRQRLQESVADVTRYPDQRCARDAVARRHGRPPEEVLLTAGAAEAFTLLARAFAPRRAVVIHPQFTEPETALRAAGRPVERLILPPDFTLDPGTAQAAVPPDADLVVVGNPTNPTSVLHPAGTLAALARPGRMLVVDEAFADCVPGEPESLAGRRDLPGLLVVRSLTKTWGLAGLRVGYVLSSAEAVTQLRTVQPSWPVSTPALAAIEACSSRRAVAEAGAWARWMGAERDRLVAVLRRIAGVHVVPDPRASFLLLRASGRPDARERLAERGFAVRRGGTFPGLGPEWLRVAVRDRLTCDAFAAALTAVLRQSPGATGRPG
jgi:histidinol-phosphate aminotransferase